MEKILKDDRLSRAVTGMSKREIDVLEISFKKALDRRKKNKDTKRKRAEGGGRIGYIKSDIAKLIFILMYVKIYPTYDVLSALIGMDRAQCCRWTHILLPALEEALNYQVTLPDRKIASMDEFKRQYPNLQDVFIDGMERPIQRKGTPKSQRKHYSGKKKQETRKNIVLTDENRQILCLSNTKRGRRHDKRLSDNIGLQHLPEDVTLWADTGFAGTQHIHSQTMMPKKKRKNKPLTQEIKSENQTISGVRILVEHAISGLKRMGSVSGKYRNTTPNFDDSLTLVSAGLWNLHLRLT